jgi:ATP-binding cassette, subfamily C (CFTR/MRP), member 4
VGERGATLSGGQKTRLSLARALYSQAKIYVLDDPISAVDAKVAQKIFDNCLRPLSVNNTVIVVTHQIGYICECD